MAVPTERSERWFLVKGLKTLRQCEFCWNTLKLNSFVYQSTTREAYECSGCRKEAQRAQKYRL